jgi:copper resistance protein B
MVSAVLPLLARAAVGLLAALAGGAPAYAADAARRAGLVVEHADVLVGRGDSSMAWDAAAWVGSARQQAWLRTSGETGVDGISASNVELLWSVDVTGVTAVLVGARFDSGTLPSRGYAAIGLHGSHWRELAWDMTGYVGRGSATADVFLGVRARARYTWPLSGRWSVHGRAEFEAWHEDHQRLPGGKGCGPLQLRTGLRLGFAQTARLTWHVGTEWLYEFQDTAEATERYDGEPNRVSIVAGVRAQF